MHRQTPTLEVAGEEMGEPRVERREDELPHLVQPAFLSTGVPVQQSDRLEAQSQSTTPFTNLSPLTPGTPTTHMSMSRSPSPALGGGGWSSPGLHTPSGPPSPASGTFVAPESWNAGRVGSSTLHPPPATSRNRSFFSRHIRKISSSLPQFRPDPRAFSQKEKPNHGQWSPHGFKPVLIMKNILSRMSRKLKLRLLLALVILGLVLIWNFSRMCSRRPAAYLFLAR